MSRFQISKEEYESIKAAEKKTKDKNVSRRLHILMMRYEGYKVKEIAEITYGNTVMRMVPWNLSRANTSFWCCPDAIRFA